MTINQYLYGLITRKRESTNLDERKVLKDKIDFARAYRNGTIEAYRSRAIEREIGVKFSQGAQLAILFNKDTRPLEYADYQAFRAECKLKVDAKIAAMSAEISKTL
jgi:hypothetical protein